jgi:hypothetical protein
LLQLIQLFVGHGWSVGRPAKKHHRVGVELHHARLSL